MENLNKQWKKMNNTVQDIKLQIKKSQIQGILEIKSLGIQAGTTEVNTNIIEQIVEDLWHLIHNRRKECVS